jgi:hypothetical protein
MYDAQEDVDGGLASIDTVLQILKYDVHKEDLDSSVQELQETLDGYRSSSEFSARITTDNHYKHVIHVIERHIDDLIRLQDLRRMIHRTADEGTRTRERRMNIHEGCGCGRTPIHQILHLLRLYITPAHFELFALQPSHLQEDLDHLRKFHASLWSTP